MMYFEYIDLKKSLLNYLKKSPLKKRTHFEKKN